MLNSLKYRTDTNFPPKILLQIPPKNAPHLLRKGRGLIIFFFIYCALHWLCGACLSLASLFGLTVTLCTVNDSSLCPEEDAFFFFFLFPHE